MDHARTRYVVDHLSRRAFLKTSAGVALATTAAPLWAVAAETPTPAPVAESVVKLLFKTMTDVQKKTVCFDWDNVDRKRGLLRSRLENNWKITRPSINSDFYTKDQRRRASGPPQ